MPQVDIIKSEEEPVRTEIPILGYRRLRAGVYACGYPGREWSCRSVSRYPEARAFQPV